MKDAELFPNHSSENKVIAQKQEKGYQYAKRDNNLVSNVTGSTLCILRNVRNEASLITKSFWMNGLNDWYNIAWNVSY